MYERFGEDVKNLLLSEQNDMEVVEVKKTTGGEITTEQNAKEEAAGTFVRFWTFL